MIRGIGVFAALAPQRGAASVRMMWAMWPSFLAAGVAEMLFFACIDPLELHPFAETGEASLQRHSGTSQMPELGAN